MHTNILKKTQTFTCIQNMHISTNTEINAKSMSLQIYTPYQIYTYMFTCIHLFMFEISTYIYICEYPFTVAHIHIHLYICRYAYTYKELSHDISWRAPC